MYVFVISVGIDKKMCELHRDLRQLELFLIQLISRAFWIQIRENNIIFIYF